MGITYVNCSLPTPVSQENRQRVILEEKRRKREEARKAAAEKKAAAKGQSAAAAAPEEEEEGCVIDNLLKEIRSGTTLRTTKRKSTRRAPQLSTKELEKLKKIAVHVIDNAPKPKETEGKEEGKREGEREGREGREVVGDREAEQRREGKEERKDEGKERDRDREAEQRRSKEKGITFAAETAASSVSGEPAALPNGVSASEGSAVDTEEAKPSKPHPPHSETTPNKASNQTHIVTRRCGQ